MRIVLLCGTSPSSWIVYGALRQHFEITRVIVEPPVPASQLLRRRLKRLGLATVVGQVLFMVLARLQAAASRPRVRRILEEAAVDATPPPEALISRVESVNDPRTAALLAELDPDAVVVNGTRIISPSTLRAVKAPFLNTHVGITPRYRGVHGGYWALASGDREHCGVTVHLVDEGIDTGDVLYQAAIEPGTEDNFSTYPTLQVVRAVPLMVAALRDVEQGTVRRRAGVGPSRMWSHPTLGRYLWYRFRKGVR